MQEKVIDEERKIDLITDLQVGVVFVDSVVREALEVATKLRVRYEILLPESQWERFKAKAYVIDQLVNLEELEAIRAKREGYTISLDGSELIAFVSLDDRKLGAHAHLLPKEFVGFDAGQVSYCYPYDKLEEYHYSEDDLFRLVDDIGEEGILLLRSLAYFQETIFSVFKDRRMLAGVNNDYVGFYLSDGKKSIAILIDRVIKKRVEDIGKERQVEKIEFEIERWIFFLTNLDQEIQKRIFTKFLFMNERYPFIKVFFRHIPDDIIRYIQKELEINLEDVLDLA